MIAIDKSSRKPLYKQVEIILRKQIDTGQYGPGARLPSIREMSKNLGINHVTVRQAVNNLVSAGLLTSNRGRGTFVRDHRVSRAVWNLMVPDLEVPLSALMARAVSKVARTNKAELHIIGSHSDPDIECENLQQVGSDPSTGLLLFSMMGLQPALNIMKLILQGMPIVLVDRYFEDIPTWHVCSDNVQAGRLATEHLIERGRRRIVFASHIQVTASRHRFSGYCETMIQNGLQPVYQAIQEPLYPGDSSCIGTRELLMHDPKPDAILYVNDRRALHGMREIKAAGLKIPDDIAVMGIDDAPMAALADPPLTTIAQDADTVGRRAAELLMEQMQIIPEERRMKPKRELVPTRLVVRDST